MKSLVIVVLVLVVVGLGAYLADRQGIFGPDDEAGRHETDRTPVNPEEAAWTVLTELLDSQDEDLRAETLEIVSDLPDPRVSKFIARALESDESAIVRLRAAGLMALAGREDLLEFVRAIAREEDDYDAYVEASRTYGRIGSPDCVPELVKILTIADDIDSDEDSQAAAAYGLALLGAREAIPHLRGLLDAEDEEIEYGSACALLLLGETDVLPKLVEGVEDDSDCIAPVLALPGNDRGVPILVSILESDEPFDSERGDAAVALADIGTEAAHKALVSAWDALVAQPASGRKGLGELRGYVAAALALAGDDRGLTELAAAATGPDSRLAAVALRGVVRLGRGLTTETLLGLTAGPERRPTVDRQISRAWAARAILGTRD